MDERQWVACSDPRPMLKFWHLKAGDRKCRLYVCALCRSVWERLSDPRTRRAVEVAERYADGAATEGELDMAFRDAEASQREANLLQGGIALFASTIASCAARAPFALAHGTAIFRAPGEARDILKRSADRKAEKLRQADLLRCIFGNPFRAAPILAEGVLAWNDGIAVKMAQGIYEERDFSPLRMGVLADALEEGGCAAAELLGHLRSDGPHARGCFAIELLLKKS